MKHTRTLLALGICAATLMASLAPADAQVRRRVHGGAVAAGIAGGILAGALIAGAAGSAHARPAPVYEAPILEDEVYCRRQHVGYNRFGEPVFRTVCR